MQKYRSLLARYPLISDQIDHNELGVILQKLELQLSHQQICSIVEFGCYSGTTSLFIRRLLDEYNADNEFHVYDSFVGLPDKTDKDRSPAGEQFKAGELSISKKQFLLNFKKATLVPPIVHKGWFSDLTSSDVPDNIGFAFLDGDYYESVMTPLQLIKPKLAPGAIIIIDDYANEALPGAAKAVDEWASRHHFKIQSIHSLAIIHT